MGEEQVYSLLEQYGPLERHETKSGLQLLLFPTREIQREHLILDNWDDKYCKVHCGNFRSVLEVKLKSNLEDVLIYSKGPEKIFTTNIDKLTKGEPWWGGPRSREKPIVVSANVVEEQVLWEALFLLRLHEYGLFAEIPQAVVTDLQGRKKLLVKGIKHSSIPVCFMPEQISDDERIKRIENAGFVPDDYDGHNMITDYNGITHIIDVIRWKWPPRSDGFRQRLCETIIKEMPKQI